MQRLHLKIIVRIKREIFTIKRQNYILAVNASCKYAILSDHEIDFSVLRYSCINLGSDGGEQLYSWNISVSPNCCETCDQKVFDVNTIIEKRRIEDRCGTIETSVCRLLPGHSEATIEYEYSYQDCCNDERG